MTTPARVQIFDKPAPQGQGSSSSNDKAPAAPSNDAGDRGLSSFCFAYEGEPDVPAGVTLAEWRRRYPPLPKPGLLHPLRWIAYQCDPRRFDR